MKKFYFIAFLFVGTSSYAQIVDIPDFNFKNALLNFFIADLDNDGNFNDVVDTNGDDEIQVSEAEAVFGLELNGLGISSLEGIQSFTNIRRLLCGNSDLSNGLDVSQNLDLEELTLTFSLLQNIDVSNNSNLTFLDVANNEITTLDISQNLNLEFLLCSFNDLLTEIDASQNSNLIYITCNESELLNSLNIKNGNNLNLDTMDASSNPNLLCIQVDDAAYANTNPVGWNKDTETIYSENCSLGIQEFTSQNYVLYPNPTTRFLNIESPETLETVKIYSINGNLLKETNSTNIDVSNLASGLYFTHVSFNGKTSTSIEKFIKL